MPSTPARSAPLWAATTLVASLVGLSLDQLGFDVTEAGKVLLVLGAVSFLACSDGGRGEEVRGIGLRDLLAVLAILGVSLATYTTGLRDAPAEFTHDEGLNGLMVVDILKGHGSFTTDRYEPGEESAYMFLQAALVSFLGMGIESMRLVTGLVAAGTPPLLYLVARRFAGVALSLVAAGLICFNPIHLHWGRLADREVAAATFQALSLLLYLRCLERRRRIDFILLGAALGMGVNVYPQFKLAALLFAGCLAWDVLAGPRDRFGARAKNAGLSLATCAVFHGPFFIHAWITGSLAMRLDSVTVWSLPFSQWPDYMASVLPDVASISSGFSPAHTVGSLYPPSLFLLAGMGFCALLAREAVALASRLRRGPEKPESEGRDELQGRLPVAMTLSLVLMAFLPPLLITTDYGASRRFITALVPVYLLAVIAFSGVVRIVKGLPGLPAKWRVAALALSCLALIPFPKPGATPWTHPTLRFSLLKAAFPISRDAPLLVSENSARFPHLGWDTATATEFLIRAYDPFLAPGLNPYPIVAARPEYRFLLSGSPWKETLLRAFPGERIELRPDAGTGVVLQIYVVNGASVAAVRGLRLASSGDSGETTAVVQSVVLPDPFPRGAGDLRWSGALYIPRAGPLTVAASATGKLELRVGTLAGSSEEGRCEVAGQFMEGWHEFALAWNDPAGRGAPPEMEWFPRSPEGVQRWEPIPAHHFLRDMPDHPLLRARPVAPAERRLTLSEPQELRLEGRLSAGYLDLVRFREHLVMLRGGTPSLEIRPPEGRPLDLWAERLLDAAVDLIPPVPSPRLVPQARMAFGPEGELLVVDAHDAKLQIVLPQTGEVRRLSLDRASTWPAAAAYHPQGKCFLVSDGKARNIRRFATDGAELAPWAVSGATALGVAPDGNVFALRPEWGGIARLSAHGEVVDLWRLPEVGFLSTLACDEGGRLFVIARGEALAIFSSEGEVLMPPEVPGSLRGRVEGFAIGSIQALDGTEEIALGHGIFPRVWARYRINSLASATPETDSRSP